MSMAAGDYACPSCGNWNGSHYPNCLTLAWLPLRVYGGIGQYGVPSAQPLSDSDVERIARRVVELLRGEMGINKQDCATTTENDSETTSGGLLSK